MSVVCAIQARMGSSRLPAKSMRALHGRPLIEHVIERALQIRGVNTVVLATSSHPRDVPLGDFAKKFVPVLYGDEADVLSRFLQVAEVWNADVLMRLTGDCPFLDPAIAAAVLDAYQQDPLSVEYLSNDTLISGYPDGTDVEVFSIDALKWANETATSVEDREHVTACMRRQLTSATLKADSDWSRVKLSVDSADDYAFAVRLASMLPPGDFSLATTLRVVQEMTG